MIYLDNNATTHPAPAVFEAMKPFLTASFGNPSSAHAAGREVRNAIAAARESVAALLGAAVPEGILITSGGTERHNWAIGGTVQANPDKKHIITTRVEHEAVRKLCERLKTQGFRVTWLETDGQGSIDLGELRDSLGNDTAIVSIMLANNETGILFPVEQAAEIVKEHSDALMHVDGVNAAGKVPINLKNGQIDLFSISAHKFHGPKGIGALYIREGVQLPSIFVGGGQEKGQRAGTEAVHQIAGLGAAAEFVKDLAAMENVRELRDVLESGILRQIPNAFLNGTSDVDKRLPNTSSISFENTNGEMILARLDDLGVCVSTGSACNSDDHTASPVLQAMNVPYSRAMGAIRFSLGRFTTREEVEIVIRELPAIIESIRKFG